MSGMLAQLVLDSPQFYPAALAAAGVALVITIWSYRPQAIQLAARWRLMLPGLRMAALLALAVSVVRPVVIRARDVRDQGAVIVLLDRSRSMSVRDYAAALSGSPAANQAAVSLVPTAGALGLLPSDSWPGPSAVLGAEIQRLGTLLDELRQVRAERGYARLSLHGVDAAEARVNQAVAQVTAAAAQIRIDSNTAGASSDAIGRLLAACQRLSDPRASDGDVRGAATLVVTARDAVGRGQSLAYQRLFETNASVRAACALAAGQSRLELAEIALSRPGSGLLWRLPSTVPVYAFAFGDHLAAVPVAGASGNPIDSLALAPSDDQTDLRGAVRQALTRLSGSVVQAVVVFSDGRQTGSLGGGTDDPAAGMADLPAPVFAVMMAPASGPIKDLAVTRLDVPASSRAGESITARVEVNEVGMNGQSVDVHLDVDGQASQTMAVNFTDRQSATATFNIKPQQNGVRTVTAWCAAVPGEATVENNRLTRWIKIAPEPLNVALWSSSATWDYQYLRDALARAPWVRLDDQFLDADVSAHLSESPEQILQHDVLVLYDLAPSALSDAQWSAVLKAASERGSGVVLVAGDAHLPAEYAGQSTLSSLLPYRGGLRPAFRTWPGKDPNFRIIPARESMPLDFLRLDEADDPLRRWSELPPIFRYMPIPDLKPGSRPLLRERDSNSVVMAETRLGLGHAILLGIQETWRWRYKSGDQDQDRFWFDLVRYAAGEPYIARSPRAWLDVSSPAVEPGRVVQIRARLFDENGGPLPADQYSAELVSRTGPFTPDSGPAASTVPASATTRPIATIVPLRAAGPTGSGMLAGTLSAPDVGDYELRLRGPPADSPSVISVPLHVQASYEAELANLQASQQPLRRICDASGGAILRLDQVDSLPSRIDSARPDETRFVRMPLWDSYYLFTFVLACLAAEWALRKRLGLI